MSVGSTKSDLIAEIDKLEKLLSDYRSIVDNSPDLLYRTDQEGNITYLSGAAFKLSGYTVEEAIGLNLANDIYLYPEDRNEFIYQMKEKGNVRNFQAQLKRKDGSVWWASTNSQFLLDKDQNIIGVEGITRDISELKKAEIALKESEEKFRSIIENSPMGVHLYQLFPDDSLVLISANKTANRILGFDHSGFIGQTIEKVFPYLQGTEVISKYKDVCKDGIIWHTEDIKYKDSTTEVFYEIHAFPTGTNKMAAFLLDITEKKEAESQKQHVQKLLQQAQRFEAIGTLAGGVAHDFNNLLMAIQGRASLILTDLNESHPHVEHISAIDGYIHSATELTKQLLGIARGGKYEVKPISLNELIQITSSMFSRTRKEIRVQTSFQKKHIVVDADYGQLEQVLLNMYVNAWQAMPTGGELYLQTSVVDLGKEYCDTYQVSPGRFAKVSVTDTGIGMSEQVQRQVFDPFFTTKEKSRGTGLGLASSYGIVRNHGGFITINSKIDFGSTFNIYLPVSKNEVREEIIVNHTLVKGSETILLIDDEQMIVDVGSAMLETLGYCVLTAGSGISALEILKDMQQKIDMVVLDLVMPDMNGEKTFAEIRKLRSGIPVLLSSGYTIDAKAEEIMRQGCTGFIQKPFNISEFSQKIRHVLEQKEEHGST